MKKLKLTMLALAIGFSLHAQESYDAAAPKKKCALLEGRKWYGSIGIGSSTPPHPTYGYSLEAGLWGTEKPTTLGLTFDAVRQDTVSKYSHWIGIKPYLTIFGTDKASFMVYLAPKVQTEDLRKNLLEIGINPIFNLNKHILFSFSVADQVMKGSPWNFGGSIGFVFLF